MVLSLDEQSTGNQETLNHCCWRPSWMLVDCHWWLHLETNCSSQLLFRAENCIYRCQMMCWVGWILFHNGCGCHWFGYEHMWAFLWQFFLEWPCRGQLAYVFSFCGQVVNIITTGEVWLCIRRPYPCHQSQSEQLSAGQTLALWHPWPCVAPMQLMHTWDGRTWV